MANLADTPHLRRHAGLGTLTWLRQAVSGLLLLALGGLHMTANHFVVEGGLRNFAQVQAYLRQPLILTLELLFLVFVTWHALLGVRAILFDLGLSDQAEKRVTGVLTILGALTVGYGVWLTWVVINL
jgi:succinate dehydrogenase hydrophobic anchor subunit